MSGASCPAGFTAVYALCDPDGVPRYVGASIAPRQRFHAHMSAARKRCSNPCHCWVKSLLEVDQQPTQQILELVPSAEAGFREYAWIRDLLLDGHPLTNCWWLLRHIRHWYSRPENQNTVSPLEARKYPTTPGSSSPPGWGT